MHRIHFTATDIARVRLQPTLGPAAETLFSVKTLRQRADEPLFGGWRQQVRGAMQPRFAVLETVAPVQKNYVDLATLAGPGESLDESKERLLARSRHEVRFELDYYTRRGGPLPAELRPIAEDLQARRDLFVTASAYHEVAIGPRWTRIRAHLDSDRSRRGAAVLDGGIDRLLSTLHPTMTWAAPTLQIQSPNEADTYLNGRGLTLVPSFFLRQSATLFDPASGQCMLVYPAELSLDDASHVWSPINPRRALANLLGKTRALVLAAIGDGMATTGALARTVGTSSAAASQHTAVLREAGLITTRRRGNTVQHSLTQAGIKLLDQH